MKVRYMSDVHLEFESYRNGIREPGYFKVEADDDANTVLVLAGDIGMTGSQHTYVPFVEEMCNRFKAVIYVLGNHEYYRASFITAVVNMRNNLSHTSAVVLDNSSVTIDDVTFIGSTMWTDFSKNDPKSKLTCQLSMNDYRLIRTGTFDDPYARVLSPDDVYDNHVKSIEYLNFALSNKTGKTVVVSHHLPSSKSVNEIFKNEFNDAYKSDLDEMILDVGPDLWIHGHTHCSTDYVLGNTRVVCNPRGYVPRDLNPEFKNIQIVEI